MIEILNKQSIQLFQTYLSSCVNTLDKVYLPKETIMDFSFSKKQIGFIEYGNAQILKTDEDGSTTIIKELKKNDIFSNLFFQDSEDEIYIISSNHCKITFIDYYDTIKNCNKGCPFHNNMVLTLFELLIHDYKAQNEKIELLSKRNVRDKIMFFFKQRMNEYNVFQVTTSYTAISEYIAVDRSHFMRELKKLEEEGFIKKDHKWIEVKK